MDWKLELMKWNGAPPHSKAAFWDAEASRSFKNRSAMRTCVAYELTWSQRFFLPVFLEGHGFDSRWGTRKIYFLSNSTWERFFIYFTLSKSHFHLVLSLFLLEINTLNSVMQIVVCKIITLEKLTNKTTHMPLTRFQNMQIVYGYN